MRVLVGASLLLLCAWNTHVRSQQWRSDEALFAAAVHVAPHLARPALNLGVALVQRGAVDEGVRWTLRSLEQGREDPAAVAAAVRHLQWINIVSGLPCYPDHGQPSWCAWLSP